MRRVWIAVMLLALCTAAGANMIENGSFEQGNGYVATGWSMDWTGDNWCRTYWPEAALEGDHVAMCDVDNSNANPDWGTMNSDVIVPAGAYQLSLWVRGDGYAPSMTLLLFLGDWEYGMEVPCDQTWRQVALPVETTLGGWLQLSVCNGGDDRVLVDCVDLEPVPEVAGLIVVMIGLTACFGLRIRAGHRL